MPQLREQRSIHSNDEYPLWIGLIFVFNLIVGTGALTLPSVFAKAGWLLGFIIIIVLAFISYMTVTFVIESMACANAFAQWTRLQVLKRNYPSAITYDSPSDDDDDGDSVDFRGTSPSRRETMQTIEDTIEHVPLFSQRSRYYVLDQKIELGEMARLFFNDTGRHLFFLCFAIYLYGDLSIYSAAVAKTLRDVICDYRESLRLILISRNITFSNLTDDSLDNQPCWIAAANYVAENSLFVTFTRLDCYRVSLIAFLLCLGPFAFFNVQKTKYIQMCTIFLRWLAFTIMISIAINRLLVNGQEGFPPMADPSGLPALFGACVYSFMCHHSLPSLVSPIRDKNGLHGLLSADYLLISCFYLCLALTGSFAFATLDDLYTLNFVPNANQTHIILKFVEYFLALFPVFTLSASFPIIAITLRNNLQTLFLGTNHLEEYGFFIRRLAFPLLAILPPIVVTFFTDSLTSLVSFTGGYAGSFIQYIIPIALVWQARRTCTQLLGQGIINDYASPFKSVAWLIFVLIWACTCVVLVTVNFFLTNTPSAEMDL